MFSQNHPTLTRLKLIKCRLAPQRVPDRPGPVGIDQAPTRLAQQPIFQIRLAASAIRAANHRQFGYGREFRQTLLATPPQWFDQVGRILGDKQNGDPGRIALAGHSAGAHTAVTLALDPRWLKAAGVAPDTVKAAIGLSGPYDFYPFDKKRSIDAMSHWPAPRDTQPIEWARADAPPMLLVTSSKDTVVRPYNTENLAAKLRELGAPVQTENYEGLSHEDVVVALSKPFRGKAPVLDRSVTFLEQAM